LWNFAYDAGYGAGPAVFGLISVRTGYPVSFALTGVLMLAAVPAAWRERKACRHDQVAVRSLRPWSNRA
jgi:predicted MFS family arabinose efflux permease